MEYIWKDSKKKKFFTNWYNTIIMFIVLLMSLSVLIFFIWYSISRLVFDLRMFFLMLTFAFFTFIMIYALFLKDTRVEVRKEGIFIPNGFSPRFYKKDMIKLVRAGTYNFVAEKKEKFFMRIFSFIPIPVKIGFDQNIFAMDLGSNKFYYGEEIVDLKGFLDACKKIGLKTETDDVFYGYI
jgi:hypothetical protein